MCHAPTLGGMSHNISSTPRSGVKITTSTDSRGTRRKMASKSALGSHPGGRADSVTDELSRSRSVGRSYAMTERRLRLYDYAASCNCYKLRLLLSHLGIQYERVPVDIFAGETLTDEYAR